jgi:hypothetical protein
MPGAGNGFVAKRYKWFRLVRVGARNGFVWYFRLLGEGERAALAPWAASEFFGDGVLRVRHEVELPI